MKAADARRLDDLADVLRETRNRDISLSDVVHVAELTAESLRAFFETVDMSVYKELRDIANFINRMKHEVGALQPNELKSRRIPAAGIELDAIVRATEKATNTIMGSAEAVMAADPTDIDAYQTLVNDQMMMIFEACSFQDITGQRVAKVIETLQYIENRVSRFAEVMDATDADGYLTEQEQKRRKRAEDLILNGPATDGSGINQADVDALFT